MSTLLNKYTNSISKSDVAQGGRFIFGDNINFSDLKEDQRKQIIFGDVSNNLLMHSLPPGIVTC